MYQIISYLNSSSLLLSVVGREGKEGNLIYCWWEFKLVQTTMENNKEAF
jgi:hypothetical protein